MKFLDALKGEIENIENNEMDVAPYLREDYTDMMICVRFADGRKHFIFPCKEKVLEFSIELNKIIIHNLWKQTSDNYKKQFLEELINDKEFKVE